MNANAISLLAIFEKKLRIEVPLFQRQYVWNREHQWEPLWEDISRKFLENLEGRKDGPVHFLGAIVLDQKQTPITHVEKRQIIDGQQRLTTLQIFVAAMRDFCRENNLVELASEFEAFTFNKGMMADPGIDKFKVWPTLVDRPQFVDVIDSGSRAELERRHPLVKKKYSKKYEPRPLMVEAYVFFYQQIEEFFVGSDDEPPLSADTPLDTRIEECLQALKNALQVVAIDLDQDDDAQVIFETLNARGEPLLPADLLRNFIFLRAARAGESPEELYHEYWERFDEPFWRVIESQGRLFRPRSDLFMQYFLASRQGADIPMKHLYVEYKYWIERERPFSRVQEELATLARQGEDFKRILQPATGDPLRSLSAFLYAFEIRTVYPVLLAALDEKIDESELAALAAMLESYLLRRAVCGLTTKNLNRTFLILTKNLRKSGFTAEALRSQLNEFTGESVLWPSDARFAEEFRNGHAYSRLNNPRIVYILSRLNETYYGTKMESIVFDGSLTVEHILPQGWQSEWPLPDGQAGLTWSELVQADPGDLVAFATRNRNNVLQRFGNLTLLTQALNSAASNRAWVEKKPELLAHSLLPINQSLAGYEQWDEAAIEARGEDLLKRALLLWPHGQ